MAISAASVLLIEDDPNDILLMKRAMSKAGLPGIVNVAVDGEQAIAFLAGTSQGAAPEGLPPPSLVLLDLKLPKVSGLEVLAWLRAQPVLRRIPVIILTSSREEHDVTLAYDLGVNAYLLKPAAFSDLVILMKKVGGFWLGANIFPEVSREDAGKGRTEPPPKRRVSDHAKA